VIVVTATITPRLGLPALVASDPSVRREQYLAVFRELLRTPGVDGIVLAENSGANLDEFSELALAASMPFEAITVGTEDWEPEDGRGYAEALLVQHALERSSLIGDEMFFKLTGRYLFRNLRSLISDVPDADLYFNLRRRPILFCDTHLYGATRKGFDLLRPHFPRLRTGAQPAERVMYDVVTSLIESGASVVPRLRREPRVEGIRGFDGRDYGSPKQRLKYCVRVVIRRAAPGVWV
jgi:hypothetical protein